MLDASATSPLTPKTTVTVEERPPAAIHSSYVIANRVPLAPTPFLTLPVGVIKPEGWLKKQLQLEASGFVGHLEEISDFLKRDTNAWISKDGKGEHGWEETPYWLKGFGDLGYVLGDNRIIDEAEFWIKRMLANQAPDGWLGPRSNLTNNDGKPDMWPNMLMLFTLQSYYEYSGDPKVVDAMRRYFKWQLQLPDDQFFLSYWEKQRGGDNLASVYWLYNRTGEKWLLQLADKIHRHTADWVGGVPDLHGVNFAQAFREPAEFAELAPQRATVAETERDYQIMRHDYGQVPGGLYGADENARPGYTDPHQAAETCAMVEMMFSDEFLVGETGDPTWAERCEDVTFNSLPASMTPDEKALHYLTAPNMVEADAGSKSPGLQNGGPMLLFNPYDHRCCQHNVAQGWPYFTEHLWFATDENGLAAVLYAPCKLTARVDFSQTATIEEQTNYPFDDQITFKFSMPEPARFALTLRLPSWCETPGLKYNGHELNIPRKGNYAVVETEWSNGDTLTLSLPMRVTVTHWPENKGAVSINRGPLTYSLKIGERYVRHGGSDKWPAFEIYPTTPWNYGLVLDGFKVEKKPFPTDGQPFDWKSSPLEITTHARKIPEWSMDRHGLCGVLQQSPALSLSPVETVTLIPMGAARLRIASFPVVSTSDGTEWKPQPKMKNPTPAQASHVWPSDTLNALSDGLTPQSSDDQSIPRFTWWDHKGTTEWVEYDFPVAESFSSASVFWFDDGRTSGGCRVPKSWRLLYFQDGAWKEVSASGDYGIELDRFNKVQFRPVSAQKWRIEAKLQEGYSSGVLQWTLG